MIMSDDFEKYREGLESPADNAIEVSPNDSVDLTKVTRAIYVGVTGNMSVEMASGQVVTFTAIQAGSILPIRVNKVRFTGTTAGGIVGIY
jgi:hypothetical protein